MKRSLLLLLCVLFSLFSCGDGDSPKKAEKVNLPKAEVPADFTMSGVWGADYKSQNLKITLNPDNKGKILFANGEEIKLLKWEEEKLSKSRINLGLYFYSRDKSKFGKKVLKMYNAGRGFKLKMVYNGEGKLSVYNGLYKDEKIIKDDGRMLLKRQK